MIDGLFPLSDRDFARIKARVRAEAGISLTDAKRMLVVSRLSKLLRALGFASFAAYLDHLETSGSRKDAQDFVNALTTNLTRFFREDHHFAQLADHVGELLGSRPRHGAGGRPRLRIWSAGCSTGQEAYSIALSLLDRHPALVHWDFRVLGTDIDTSVLAKAAHGRYPASELQGLSAERTRLFERDGSMIIVPAPARERVTFKVLNLMSSHWPMRGPFDAIFCRNVAIYFDKPTQGELFSRLGKLLVPEGFLYIGHSENLGSGSEHFRLVGKTIYQSRITQKTRDAA